MVVFIFVAAALWWALPRIAVTSAALRGPRYLAAVSTLLSSGWPHERVPCGLPIHKVMFQMSRMTMCTGGCATLLRNAALGVLLRLAAMHVPNVSHDDVHRGLCNFAAECRTGGSLAVSRYANDAAKVFDATEIDATNRRVW